MQGRLELMGRVGGEFLADQRGLLQFLAIFGQLLVLVVEAPQQRQEPICRLPGRAVCL